MYTKELTFAKTIIKNTYLSLIDVPLEIMDKGDFDTVTNIDYAVEKTLITAIKKAFPGDHIISEEFNPAAKVKGRTWVIDPIDGTVNFARQNAYFGIQLAFFADNEVVLSYMYFPRLNEEYHALQGHGVFRNDMKLERTSRPVAHMIMSFSDFFVYDEASNRFVEKIFLGVKDTIFRTRLQGSAAIDFSFVASGTNDALVLRTNNLWDLAPGFLMMKELGYTVVNEKLTPYTFSDFALIAFNNDELLPILKMIIYN